MNFYMPSGKELASPDLDKSDFDFEKYPKSNDDFENAFVNVDNDDEISETNQYRTAYPLESSKITGSKDYFKSLECTK